MIKFVEAKKLLAELEGPAQTDSDVHRMLLAQLVIEVKGLKDAMSDVSSSVDRVAEMLR